MKELKNNYKIDFIENPEVFSDAELNSIYGGFCFVNFCRQNIITKKNMKVNGSKDIDLTCTEKIYFFRKVNDEFCVVYKHIS